VDHKNRAKSWASWVAYAGASNFDPWMRGMDKTNQQQRLLAFAARFCTGIFGNGRKVGFQSVEKALRHVAQALVLAGYEDPRRSYGAKELDLPISAILSTYRKDDPPPQPQLALPVATIEHAATFSRANQPELTRATADLLTVAFFYLLQVGEYTMPRANTRTRTTQFQVKDVTFRDAQGYVLPNTAPYATLAQAASATLYLDNQKNGRRGDTIHHTACLSWFCPVKALARRVAAIMAYGVSQETPLSFVRPGKHVVASNVTNLVQRAARETNLVAKGYSPRRIGTHSLRASGAMALKLDGVDDTRIMKIGRWTGLTFMVYIHAQIGALNAGLAQRMAQRIEFVNVAA
jgi:hypothetical protein